MAQIKIFGIGKHLGPIRKVLSDTIHHCVVEALKIPIEKRFHRFFLMNQEDMIYPDSRTDRYTIIEIEMIEGRSDETKKRLLRLLFDKIQDHLGIGHNDLEICIQESPIKNWGFRGMTGDEIALDYKINV